MRRIWEQLRVGALPSRGSRHFRAKSDAKQALDIARESLAILSYRIELMQYFAFGFRLLPFGPELPALSRADHSDAGILMVNTLPNTDFGPRDPHRMALDVGRGYQ